MKRVDMAIAVLKSHPDQKFTARQLAQKLWETYPKSFNEKRAKYKTDAAFFQQLTAELNIDFIGRLTKVCPNVAVRSAPKPRLYFWQENAFLEENETKDPSDESDNLNEHSLYPLLMEYARQNHNLYCLRIDEKTSTKTKGAGWNRWLHPDVVALEVLDQEWKDAVKKCVRAGGFNRVRLWSFEVKRKITAGNVRECFFQTVSNSSWANYSYLVIAELDGDKELERELQMLCALHGVGVLILDSASLRDSRILIPARLRLDVDWLSVNRICQANKDFERYIKGVHAYLSNGDTIYFDK